MPRIRTIKPEFWADEKLSQLDPTTRLVFLALISLADDSGRLVDNVKQLDGAIFPNTRDTCGKSLETLARLSRITRYTARSGQSLLQVTNWELHQKITHPSKHVLPGPEDGVPREALATSSGESHEKLVPLPRTMDLGPRTMDHGPDDFEEVWKQYPKRGGGNSKADARRRWVALRANEVPVADLLAGVQRYARFAAQTGKVGTELVMQAARFFGPGEHWREEWPIPAQPVDPREQRSSAPRPPTAQERQAAAAREVSDEQREARIDRAYTAARDAAVREWMKNAAPEQMTAVYAKADMIGAPNTPMGLEIRKSAADAEIARLAGFPDRDAWVIIENAERRARKAS